MSGDRTLQARIEACAGRAAAWLWSMQAPSHPRGVLRFSVRHDPGRWPGALLPSTYNGVMALDLLSELGRLSPSEKEALADFLKGFRAADGVFAIPEMREGRSSRSRIPRRPGGTSAFT